MQKSQTAQENEYGGALANPQDNEALMDADGPEDPEKILLPKYILGNFSSREQLALHLCKIAGYQLELGNRHVTEIWPLIDQKLVGELIGATTDIDSLKAEFCKLKAGNIPEIVIFVEGKDDSISINDYGSLWPIPQTTSRKSTACNYEEFHVGDVVEVSESYSAGKDQPEFRMAHAAQISSLLVRVTLAPRGNNCLTSAVYAICTSGFGNTVHVRRPPSEFTLF